MFHVSILHLNPGSSAVRRDRSDPYAMHRTLWRAFPAADAGGAGRVLWRLESRILSNQHDRDYSEVLLVYVQSRHPPEWMNILAVAPDYFARSRTLPPAPAVFMESAPKDTAMFWSISRWEPLFVLGQTLTYRLRANPIVHQAGQRVPLVDSKDQCQWLWRQAQAGGFVPLRTTVQPPTWVQLPFRDGGTIPFLAVEFSGRLRVLDVARFLNTLEAGIGEGKAFGFGLLWLDALHGRDPIQDVTNLPP